MYLANQTPRATTRGVLAQPSQAEIDDVFAGIVSAPDMSELSDRAFTLASMHPEVGLSESSKIELQDEVSLHQANGGWLDKINTADDFMSATPGAYIEPSAVERQTGEVVIYKTAQIAQITERMPEIRALAIQNGRASFSRDSDGPRE